jgi:hypothetical protein
VEPDPVEVAEGLWRRARDQQQAVVRVDDDEVAAQIRATVRRLAAAEGVRIRTARMGQGVAVVRLDADIWRQDAETMRRKLELG